MKKHTVVLSNGKTIRLKEGVGSIGIYYAEDSVGDDDWFLCEINRDGITCCTNCGGANEDVVKDLQTETCGQLIFKDDWSFAESSERPWASESSASPAGQAIMRLYERYKPTLQMLSEEGGPTLPVYDEFVEYMENAFDAQCEPE